MTFALVFPGQGSQSVGMMQPFAETKAVRDVFARASEVLKQDLWRLAEQGPDGARHKVLRVAPLSVGGLLRERLFGQRTTVLTSATLALGGSFDALTGVSSLSLLRRRRVGDSRTMCPSASYSISRTVNA